jgi:hypothetical protein
MVSFCFNAYSAAMKNNKTNFAITGAAALFVGLAGTAQAIPIPVHAAQSIIQSNANKKLAGPVAFVSHAPVPPKKPAKKTKHVPVIPVIVTIPDPGSIPVPSFTMPVVSPTTIDSGLVLQPVTLAVASVTSVPDGGATGAMLGGIFGGLVLLRKKLKA